MKVIRQISTGVIVYRESPEFLDGEKAKKSASKIYGIPENDLSVSEVTIQDWDNRVSDIKRSRMTIEDKLSKLFEYIKTPNKAPVSYDDVIAEIKNDKKNK